MKNEILITDLFEAAVEKERISEEISKSKWRVLDYETSFCSGKLLCVSDKCHPKPVTLRLSAVGKYDIYLGTVQMRGAPTAIALRLSGTEEISHIKPTTAYDWTPLETVAECFWKSAELDGEDLILSKPDDYIPQSAALAWIRLVPWQNEYAKSAEVVYHLDSDYFTDDNYTTPESVCGRIEALADGGASVILQEVLPSYDNEAYAPDEELFPRAARFGFYRKNKRAVEKALVDKAHGIGSEIYAAYRLQASEFAPPNDFGGTNHFFREDYSAVSSMSCFTRDGRRMSQASYAYPEVRKKAVDTLLSFMDSGFDGVSLIFCRGILVGFEKPVLDEIRRVYGVDGRRLPMSDPRYHRIAASFVTEFMKELRAALDEKYTERKKINAVVLFTPEDSLYNGFDTEEWVRLGLVDSVCQGLMRVYEDLDGTLDEDGLIDLERYEKVLLERRIIKRDFRINDKTREMLIRGAEEFEKICHGKADFYATLLWEAQTEDETVAITDMLKALGIRKFISWNANHKAKILNRINAEKFYTAGSPEEYNEKRARYYRTLSIGGTDMSQFDPNWKG